MKRSRATLCFTLAILVTAPALMLPSRASAADSARYSGTLVSVDEASGLLVLEVMGPWTGEVESTVTRRELRLGSDPEVRLLRRDPEGTNAGGWRGGFAESPITLSAIRPGDYVTVQTGARGVVGSIEVVRPEGLG